MHGAWGSVRAKDLCPVPFLDPHVRPAGRRVVKSIVSRNLRGHIERKNALRRTHSEGFLLWLLIELILDPVAMWPWRRQRGGGGCQLFFTP